MDNDFAEKTKVVLEILLFYQQMQNPLSAVDGNVYTWNAAGLRYSNNQSFNALNAIGEYGPEQFHCLH